MRTIGLILAGMFLSVLSTAQGWDIKIDRYLQAQMDTFHIPAVSVIHCHLLSMIVIDRRDISTFFTPRLGKIITRRLFFNLFFNGMAFDKKN